MKLLDWGRLFDQVIKILVHVKHLLNRIQKTPGFRFNTGQSGWNASFIESKIGKIDLINLRLQVFSRPDRAHLKEKYKTDFVTGMFFADVGVVENEGREMKEFLDFLFDPNGAFAKNFENMCIIFSTIYRAAWDLPGDQASEKMRELKYGWGDFNVFANITLASMGDWNDHFPELRLFSHIDMVREVNNLSDALLNDREN